MQLAVRIARWAEVLFAVISLLLAAGLPITPSPGEAAGRVSLVLGALLALWFAWRLPRGHAAAQVGAPLLALVTSAPALTSIALGGLTGPGAPAHLLGRIFTGAWVSAQLVVLACWLFTPTWRRLITADWVVDEIASAPPN